MIIRIPYLIAVLSTTAFFVLWFCVVRKELRVKQSMLHSAEGQLLTCREKYEQMRDGPDVKGVLKRSIDIYRQSLELYNETLRRPWFFFPGILMGFRQAVNYNANGGVKL